MMQTTMATILQDDIRKLIVASGVSRYRLCQNAGIDQSQMSRFMAGTQGLGAATLSRLLDELGFEVVLRRKRRGRKRK